MKPARWGRRWWAPPRSPVAAGPTSVFTPFFRAASCPAPTARPARFPPRMTFSPLFVGAYRRKGGTQFWGADDRSADGTGKAERQ